MFTNLRKTQRAYLSLSNALERLQAEVEQQTIYAAIKRGYFLPKEDYTKNKGLSATRSGLNNPHCLGLWRNKIFIQG